MIVPRVTTALALGAAVTAVAAAGCGGGGAEGTTSLPQGSEPVTLDPANFVSRIDNPYWPLLPGARWVYRETEGDAVQRVEVTVTGDTKVVDGITATVVHDLVTEDGEPIEDTIDWYAQDRDGNVWYLGEDTKEYENGEVVSTQGSWEAGVDGAVAGVIVPAVPEPGTTYRQEYYAGEAEDTAQVLSVSERAEVPAGSYEDVLLTKDFTPLDPAILEYKLYAPAVGPVLVLGVSGGSSREELVSFTPGA